MPVFNGTAFNDTLTGTAGRDTIFGFDGDDIIQGEPSGDLLFGDSINGGAGYDVLIYDERASSQTTYLYVSTGPDGSGSAGSNDRGSGPFDLLSGIEQVSIFTSNVGGLVEVRDTRSVVFGGEGNDFIKTGNAVDQLYGGGGNDTIQGGEGTDILVGGAGDDFITPEDFKGVIRFGNIIDGGDGYDVAIYDDRRNTASQGNFILDLSATSARSLRGSPDSPVDQISGIEQFVVFSSSQGSTVSGSQLLDVMWGNGGADDLRGNDGDDQLRGEDGNDVLSGGNGADSLFGGTGDDILDGGFGRDTIQGNDGNDQIYGGDEYDSLNGGSGFDVVRYDASVTGVSVDLLTGVGRSGDAEGDVVLEFEAVSGSNFNDNFFGTEEADTFFSWLGNDFINGRGGVDVLLGGGGNDTLVGGADADFLRGDGGADRFKYLAASDSTSTAMDFVSDFSSLQGDKFDFSTITNASASFNTGWGSGASVYAFNQGGWALVQVYSGSTLQSQIIVNQANLSASDFIL